MPPVSLGDKARYGWHETLGDDDNAVLLVIRDNLKHMPDHKIRWLALYHARTLCRVAEGMQGIAPAHEICLHDWSLACYVICVEALINRMSNGIVTAIDRQMQEEYPQLWKEK